MIVGIANQIVGSKLYTGGDVLSFEVLKRNKGKELAILAPLSLKVYIEANINNVHMFVTDKGDSVFITNAMTGIQTLYRYFVRTFFSIIILEKNIKKIETLYLTGDFICNTLPAFYLKMRKKNIKIVLNFYHRNPRPKDRKSNLHIFSAASRMLQTCSLLLIRPHIHKAFVLSDIGFKELEKLHFREEKIIITGGGSDDRYLRALNIENNRLVEIKNNSRKILMVGRLSRTKGIFDLPKILKNISLNEGNWEFNIAGVGHENDIELFRRELNKYNLEDRVNILGYVSEEKKWKLLLSSKIFILTSHEEGFSIVTQEALMARCRVVAYRLDSLYSLFHNYDIHFVKKFNKIDFSQKVDELLRKPYQSNCNTMEVQSWDDLATKHFAEI